MIRRRLALLGILISGAGCGATTTDYVPVELKERMPPLDELAVAIPGKAAGAEESASRAVHGHIAELRQRLSALSVLRGFFEDGGDRQRGASLFVALESPPHVADPVERFTRDRARLDVERRGDHALYYLQYDRGDGFAPDDALDTSRMLIDGGTIGADPYGTRPPVSKATGIHDPTVGYMRVHFNHRAGDDDPVNDAIHFDYDTNVEHQDEVFTLRHFLFARRPDVNVEDGQLAAMLVATTEGWGWALRSERRGGGVIYSWIAIFEADGSLAVWNNDGSVWACYDGSGNELGNTENPEPCAAFKRDLRSPPGGLGVWRGLPF